MYIIYCGSIWPTEVQHKPSTITKRIECTKQPSVVITAVHHNYLLGGRSSTPLSGPPSPSPWGGPAWQTRPRSQGRCPPPWGCPQPCTRHSPWPPGGDGCDPAHLRTGRSLASGTVPGAGHHRSHQTVPSVCVCVCCVACVRAHVSLIHVCMIPLWYILYVHSPCS